MPPAVLGRAIFEFGVIRAFGVDGFRLVFNAEAGRVGVLVVPLFVGVVAFFPLEGVLRGGGAELRPVGVLGMEPVDALSISLNLC